MSRGSPILMLGSAVFPVLTLYVSNLDIIARDEIGRPLLIVLLVTLILYLAIRIAGSGPLASSITASSAMILILSYGHVYRLAKGLTIAGFLLGRHRYLLPLWIIVLVAMFRIAGRIPLQENNAPRTLDLIGMVLIALPVARLLWGLAGGSFLAGARDRPSPVLDPELTSIPDPPDIYYVVLDGYGREDVLFRSYDIDQREFLAQLRSRGFQVADRATANYPQTRLSLTATLNMEYVDRIVESSGTSSRAFSFSEWIRDSRVRASLEGVGYQTIAFETGFPASEVLDADLYLSATTDPRFSAGLPIASSLTPFEGMLLQTSIMRFVSEVFFQSGDASLGGTTEAYADHAIRILYTLDQLARAARLDGPQFVIAHLLAPHPPFVFGSEGEVHYPEHPYSLLDGAAFPGSDSEYSQGYRDQVEFVNRELLATLDMILSESPEPPIIVMHGDHGPGLGLDLESMEETDLEERFGILVAYFNQGEYSRQFAERITPVNLFRVVFNDLFAADLPLLENRSYFSTFERPLELTPVPPWQVQ